MIVDIFEQCCQPCLGHISSDWGCKKSWGQDVKKVLDKKIHDRKRIMSCKSMTGSTPFASQKVNAITKRHINDLKIPTRCPKQLKFVFQYTVFFFFFFFLFINVGPPKEDIFSEHLLCPIFQSTLHITITSLCLGVDTVRFSCLLLLCSESLMNDD